MNITETKLFIQAADLTNMVPLIEGKHGLGKSEIVKQYANENNMYCEPLILSLMDVGDLLGLPRTAEIGGQLSTVWAAQQWFQTILNHAWPEHLEVENLVFNDKQLQQIVKTESVNSFISREHLNTLYCNHYNVVNDTLHLHTQSEITYLKSRRSVLFLDEFNRAPTDILNASLQLILDKRLNSHRLPIVNGKPTMVVAAVNPADADYTVNVFDPALLDRFMHCTVTADAKAWLDDYARPNNLASVVRDFIAEHPDRIHYTPADGTMGSTPRSLTNLARIVDKADQIAPEILFQTFKGCVGQDIAAQFFSYYNNYEKVVKVEDIEALVAKKMTRTKDVKKLATHVKKLTQNQEAIQKLELAENLYTKYINSKTLEDAMPLMAYLYSVDLEILNGFLKNKKADDMDTYLKLAALDEPNDKALFKSIRNKITTETI